MLTPPSYINPSIDDVYSPNYVHPGARRLFAALPFTRHIPIFGDAANSYGPTRVGAFGVCYFLSKGIADNIITYASQPLFMKRYQRLSSITTMGWSIKAFTAMLCDAFAAFGYTKRWYMLVSTIGGGVFALVLGLLPAKESSANTACAFIFLTAFSKANVDILAEGLYSRLLRRRPKAGSTFVSWIWCFIMIGSIIAAAIQGPLSDSSKVQDGIFVSAALQIVFAPIFIFNLYEERTNRVDVAAEQAHDNPASSTGSETEPAAPVVKVVDHQEGHQLENDGALIADLADDMEREEEVLQSLEAAARARVGEPAMCLFGAFEVNRDVFGRNWKIFAYKSTMTFAVVTMTCGKILADTLGLLMICIIVSTVCCAASFWALPLVSAKANVFGYLQMMPSLQLPGALAKRRAPIATNRPDRRRFPYSASKVLSTVIGNVAGLAGVTAFNHILSRRSYRLAFSVTTMIEILTSVFDIVMVKRWNSAIGIPDHAMFIMGDAIIFQVCSYLAWMPHVTLLSRIFPLWSERMINALMAGFSNMGQSLTSSLVALIMEYGWGVSTPLPCDFSNVPWLVFVGHIMVPLLIISLSLLLPAARICDDIDVDGEAVKTEGEGKVMRGAKPWARRQSSSNAADK